MNTTNPWNGLRTYAEGELIYGRNEEIHALSLLIMQNTQTVVYGRSGIGKSSLLNAGIFPVVRRHGIFPVYIRLEHNSEQDYPEQVKAAVLREAARLGYTVRELVKGREGETMWEFFHRYEFSDSEGNAVMPMAVFDQFEEIFTLEKREECRRRFFSELADLINNVMPDGVEASSVQSAKAGAFDIFNLARTTMSSAAYKTTSDFRLVFTLREDFLSYLERNTTAIPGLKNNRYCLQPINDEQAADIIMCPRQGLVDVSVAKLIIEKVTGEDKFEIDGVPEIQVDSAILSLYLSRLYDKMQAEGLSHITAGLVETYSDNIIEDFYSDAICDIPKPAVEWLEDTLVNADGRRDNRDRRTVLRSTGLTDSALRHLTEEVKLLRQFSYGGDLRIEYIHDVLCPVITSRRTKRNEERRIAAVEAAAAREKEKSRRRILAISIGAAVLVAAVAFYFARNYWLYHAEVSACYRAFTFVNGYPQGVGPQLDAETQARTPLYYKLSRKGHAQKEYTDLEVCSSNAVIPAGVRLSLFDILDEDERHVDNIHEAYKDKLSHVRRIFFKSSAEGNIDRIYAYDDGGEVLFMINRSARDGADWYAFTDVNGQSMTLCDNGLDRVRVTMDSLKRFTAIDFYDRFGAKKSVCYSPSSPHGFAYTFLDQGTDNYVREDLSAYGVRGNAVLTEHRGDSTLMTYWKSYPDIPGNDSRIGVHRIVQTPEVTEYYELSPDSAVYRLARVLDSHGNILKERRYNTDENNFFLYPEDVENLYDESGRLLQRITRQDTITKEQTLGYMADGTLALDRTTINGVLEKLYKREVEDGGKVIRTTTFNDNHIDNDYTVRVDSLYGDTLIVTTFTDRDGRLMNGNDDGHKYCRRTVRHVGDTEEKCLYYIDDKGNVTRGELIKKSTWEYEPGVVYRTVEQFNKEGQTANRVEYAAADTVVSSMMYFYTNGVLSGHAVMGIDGTPVRCPQYDIDHFGYYRLAFSLDYQGSYTGIEAFDEFGSKTPIDDSGQSIRFYYNNFKGSIIKFIKRDSEGINAQGNINLLYDYWQYYPVEYSAARPIEKVVYLHILTKESPLYKAGLRDGDIIINRGTPAGAIDYARKALESNEVSIFRVEGNQYVVRQFKLPVGATKGNNYHLHLLPLSAENTNKLHSDNP